MGFIGICYIGTIAYKYNIILAPVVGFVTGIFCALVGIGGGIVFAPFLLIIGIPSVQAIASSATCVLFTSSSTTIQFFVLDRINLLYALLFGSVNVFASIFGQLLIKKWGKSDLQWKLTSLVAVTVLISLVMVVVKLVQLEESEG